MIRRHQVALWIWLVAGMGPMLAVPVTAKDLNVAFVYVGPIGDGGWTYAHDQ